MFRWLRHQPHVATALQAELAAWLQKPLGRELLAAEQSHVDRLLEDVFGYHALQLGLPLAHDTLARSRITHRIAVFEDEPAVPALSPLQALPEQLPLVTGSIDQVVIQHLLDLSEDPHTMLREVARVLIPDGSVVIVGFNPISIWGFWRFLNVPWAPLPQTNRDLPMFRLADWLELLDFDVVSLETTYFAPPTQSPKVRRWMAWLTDIGERLFSLRGAVYIFHARKRQSCITPIKLKQVRTVTRLNPALATRCEPSAKRESATKKA